MPIKTKQSEKTKQAVVEIDAAGQILGRIASHIAVILQGKDRPDYIFSREIAPVQVRVKNIAAVKVTGKKFTDKEYFRHAGRLGHLYRRTFEEQFERSPARVLERAVYNMLPKNRLRAQRMRRLIIE